MLGHFKFWLPGFLMGGGVLFAFIVGVLARSMELPQQYVLWGFVPIVVFTASELFSMALDYSRERFCIV
jgi:hypothetical protein